MVNNNLVIPCDLTSDQKHEIGKILADARPIVVRVSSVLFGKLSIREFRRLLPTGALDVHLSADDRKVLEVVRAIEPIVTSGFVKMVCYIAHRFSSGKRHLDKDDLIQEGLNVILLSMMGYTTGTDMSTYFYYIVLRHFIDIAKKNRHQAKNCALGEIDVMAPPEEEEETPRYDVSKLRYAIQCVRLNELEQTVLNLVLEGHQNPFAEAAMRVTNLRTGKPYSIMSAHNSYNAAKEKITAVYRSLLVRAEEAA